MLFIMCLIDSNTFAASHNFYQMDNKSDNYSVVVEWFRKQLAPKKIIV